MGRAGIIVALLMPPLTALDADDEYAAVRDTIRTCYACHGELGARPLPSNPIIAGQEYYYLYTQLKDFNSGLRKNEMMKPIVDALQPDQMKLLAKFFSEQAWPAISHQADRGNVEVARQAIDTALPRVISATAATAASANPGQYRVPLSDARFQNKVRNNAPDKSALLALYGEKELRRWPVSRIAKRCRTRQQRDSVRQERDHCGVAGRRGKVARGLAVVVREGTIGLALE
jgi:cytochrome c553